MESSGGSLDALQRHVLVLLASYEPRFILGGGGALAIYLGHRGTRDLDLFWDMISNLDEHSRAIARRLGEGGLAVSVVQQSPGFVRMRVADAESAIIVDLIADPTERLSPPSRLPIDGVLIEVESLRDLLVNKLCALLSRSELRDLIDVKALVDFGISLDDAINSAPRKDGGFSPLTLAWVLQSFDLRLMAGATPIPAREVDALVDFSNMLIDRLLSSK